MDLMETSTVGSAQDGDSSRRIRKRTYETSQKYGAFRCKYCNHRSDRIQDLEMHEAHHSAHLECRCPFCTFSSKRASSLGYHVNRVHLDQKKRKLLDECTLAKRMQENGDVVQPENEKEALKEGISGEKHPLDLSTPQKRQNSIPPSGEEVDIIDFELDSDKEEMGDGEMIEPLDLSHGGQFDPRKPGAHVSTTQPLPRSESSVHQTVSPQEESDVCRSEVTKLVPEIQAAFEILLQTEKSLKEARSMQMAGFRAVNDFRKKMEIVERENRSLSVQLTVLTEQDESLQQRLKELAAQKAQLGEEINRMRHVAISKRINLEFDVLDSSQSSVDHGEEIRQKRRALIDATEKLAATMVEKTYLATRIRAFGDKKNEITPTLVKMRAGYSTLQGNSTSESTSALGGQLKALVREQCMRIERCVNFEKKIAKLRFDSFVDEIDRKKGQWLEALKNCGNE